jgi:hypothetical protein
VHTTHLLYKSWNGKDCENHERCTWKAEWEWERRAASTIVHCVECENMFWNEKRVHKDIVEVQAATYKRFSQAQFKQI